MKKRTKDLMRSLSEIFEGEPWYGESVMRKLENVSYEIGYKICIPESHSVAEIIGHLTAWKLYAVEKLKTNSDFEIKIDSKTDWPDIEVRSPKEWEALKGNLVAAQSEIYEYLEKKPDDSYLDEKVKGKEYNFEYLILGIIHHDIYHLGQIGLIESQLKNNELNSGVFKA